MEKKAFSIRDCASYGWRTTFSNIGLSIGIVLTIIGVIIAPIIIFILVDIFIVFAPFIIIIVAIFTFPLMNGMHIGFIRIAFDLYDEGTSKITRLFSGFRFRRKSDLASLVLLGIVLGVVFVNLLFSYLIMKLLFLTTSKIIMMAVGGISLVVTILFIVLRTSFSLHRIVDKNVGSIEGLLYSFRVTKGLFWKVFGLFIVSGFSFITIIGIPASAYMWTAAYRKLSTQTS